MLYSFSLSCPACMAVADFKHTFCTDGNCYERIAAPEHTHVKCNSCKFAAAMKMNKNPINR